MKLSFMLEYSHHSGKRQICIQQSFHTVISLHNQICITLFHSPNLRIEMILSISCLDAELEKVWELKPLVDGKGIMDILKITSGGPIVKEWVSPVAPLLFNCMLV